MSMQTGLNRIGRVLGVAAADLPVEGMLPSFDGASGWLNSQPLTPSGVRGHVVVVQFWTYTCINCIHTKEAKTNQIEAQLLCFALPLFGVVSTPYLIKHRS